MASVPVRPAQRATPAHRTARVTQQRNNSVQAFAAVKQTAGVDVLQPTHRSVPDSAETQNETSSIIDPHSTASSPGKM